MLPARAVQWRQRRDVYFGVDLRRVRLAVTQELADLDERGAATQQVRGERMAQQMCALELRGQISAPECATNDAANG